MQNSSSPTGRWSVWCDRSGCYQLSYFVGYLSGIIRFWYEECARGQAFFGHLYVPRSNNDFYRGPSSANIVGELQPIHRARHVDIRHNKTDFLVQFEQSNGSVGAARLINLEASVLDEVNRPHPDQRLVLHDQN